MFKDKSVRIVIVESNASLRQLVADSLRAAGYKSTQALASLDDAKAFTETENFDWLILPLGLDQTISGVSFLRLTVEYPEFKHIRVSFFVDVTDEELLPKCFEYGALNYFQKPSTKDAFNAELSTFQKRMECCNYEEPLVASLYLYDTLKNLGHTKDLLFLTKRMQEFFPGHFELMKRMIESCYLNKLVDQSKSCYQQSLFMFPVHSNELKELANSLFGKSDIVANEEAASNILNVKHVVLVDKDDTERTKVTGVLTELGITEVSEFNDGEQAWGFINEQEKIDLLICEWKIPSLTGPYLIQRVRQKFPEVPIIIQSSVLKATDMVLLKELGISDLVQKPIEREQFLKSLVWTIQQDRTPVDRNALENKFFGLVNARKLSDAKNLMGKYCENEQFPKAKKNILQAEFALSEGYFIKARDLSVLALKIMPDNVTALNTLGKCFMGLRQYPSAIKCFQKAQTFSPNNLDRLCMLAEARAEIGEVKQSSESLDHAQHLDSGSTTVQEAGVKVALASHNLIQAKKLMGQITSLGKLISYLNNKAVAHAKSGFNSEGLVLYDNTLKSIPDSRPDLKARVLYNISLAQIRDGKMSEAISNLKSAVKDPDSIVFSKAKSLLKRCEEAKAKNTALMLRENDAPSGTITSKDVTMSQDAVETMLEIGAGEKALYLVFTTEAPLPDVLKKWMEQSLDLFKRRAPMEKDSSLNAAA